MMTRKQQSALWLAFYRSDLWPMFYKSVFVLMCCAAGAGFAANLLSECPPLVLVIPLLFMSILAVAGWLGMCGKQSASWAFLAYGSWVTIPVLSLLYLLWFEPKTVADYWVLVSVTSCVSAVYIWGGLRSAVCGKWGQVAAWWAISICAMVLSVTVFAAINTNPLGE